jgi:LmbE family N-acetylglucosaminyl deacetylase
MFKRTLIISPHRDDEVLGCGGVINRLPPKSLHIRYYNAVHPAVEQWVYDKEYIKLIKTIGCTASVCPTQDVNKLDMHSITIFISDMENTLNLFKPDTVLIPFPSYNQDHRHLFEAAVTATRVHDENHYVKNIIVYESPETLQTNRIEPRFTPHLFVPIDIEKKIKLYKIYNSQQRGHRTTEHLKALASVRGMQCNCKYAEAFMIIRQTL